MIAIPVPKEVSAFLKEIDVSGDRDESDHVTLFHLGDDLEIETFIKCIKRCVKITETFKPFELSLDHYCSFKNGDKGFPIICPVLDNKKLFTLHKKLQKKLDTGKVEYSKKFPDYKPHVTLSFSKNDVKETAFSKICFQVSKIAIYGGDKGKEKIYAELHFEKKEIEKSSHYIEAMSDYFYKLSHESQNTTIPIWTKP